MSGRYSTNWDRKGWPGLEIQMYYDCPCIFLSIFLFKYISKHLSVYLSIINVYMKENFNFPILLHQVLENPLHLFIKFINLFLLLSTAVQTVFLQSSANSYICWIYAKHTSAPPPGKNDVLKKVSVIFAKEVRQYDPSLKSQLNLSKNTFWFVNVLLITV